MTTEEIVGLSLTLLVMLAGLTTIPKEPFWKNAVTSGAFETAVIAARPLLPEDLRKRIAYR